MEKFANPAVPGTPSALTALAAAITDPAATTISVVAAAPAALQGGEFRILIDAEILLVTAGAAGTTWTVTRNPAGEGSTATSHSIGAAVTHILTKGALDRIRADDPANIPRNQGIALQLVLGT